MSLTWALVATAVAVLAGLAFHGWWSTRRATPRRPGHDSTSQRVEPSLAVAEAVPADVPVAPLDALDSRAPALRRAAVRLDALIDAIVPLRLEAPITGDLVLFHLPATRRAGSKPFYIEGLDAETGEWEPPAAGRRYGELQSGVQLANRSGAINEIEYSEFLQKVEGFAEAVGALPESPDMLEVVARARELDALTSPLDAQLTVTLRANSVAWSVGFIQQCAGRHGFVAGVLPGRMVLPGSEDGAPPVLVLAFDAQAALADDPQSAPVRECTLTLDVPQTPESAEPFPAWHDAARQLADEMDAVLVDDQGTPVTLHAFAAIGAELKTLYRQLESLDLAAGSAAARRLFG